MFLCLPLSELDIKDLSDTKENYIPKTQIHRFVYIVSSLDGNSTPQFSHNFL